MKQIKFVLTLFAIIASVTLINSNEAFAVAAISDLKPTNFKIIPISDNQVVLLWKNSELTPPPGVGFTGHSLVRWNGLFGIFYNVPPITFNGQKYFAFLDYSVKGTATTQHDYNVGSAYAAGASYDTTGVVSYDTTYYATSDLQSIVQSRIHSNVAAPAIPKRVTVSTVDYQSLKISWEASPNATGYLVYRDDFIVAAVTGTTYTDTSLPQVSTHKYTVSSYSGENISARSVSASGTTAVRVGHIPVGAVDTEAPSAPTNLKITPVSTSTVEFSWTPSTDDVGVTGYYIWRDNLPLTMVRDGLAIDRNVSANHIHGYVIQAYDASGSWSNKVSKYYIKIEPINGVCVPVDTNLSLGSAGPKVVALQKWFIDAGFTLYGGASGTYGPNTVSAVSLLQEILGMDNTSGSWGPLTRTAIENMCTTFPPTGTIGTTVPPVIPLGIPASVSATLVDAYRIRGGGGFHRVIDINNLNSTEWHFTTTVSTPRWNEGVSSIDIWNNEFPGEAWSTSNKQLYPIRVTGGANYNSSAYGDVVPVSAGRLLQFYFQTESTVFNGGVIRVTFTDGSVATGSIPRSTANLVTLPATSACHAFDTNLTAFAAPVTGLISTEVTYMQKWLISQGFLIPSLETGAANYGYYGAQTVDAVADFQRSVGISNGGGTTWGPSTRAKANALCNTVSPVIPPVVVVPPVIVAPTTTTPVIVPPVVVVPPASTQPTVVKVLYPNGGESFTSGQQIQVRWNAVSDTLGITSSSRVRIDLNLGGRNIISADNLVNDGNETITVPSTVSTDSAYTISIGAYGTKGGLSDVSDGGFTITSPVVKPVASYTISSYLSDASEDWVTSTTFTSGNGRGGTKNDWDWYAKISGTNLDSTGKTIKSVTVYSNSGEGWSTSASTDNDLHTTLMPLRIYNIYSGQYMGGYDVDLGLKISTSQNPLELVAYGQVENKSFTGGRMVVKFADGSSLTATIPAYTGVVASTDDSPLTASIWNAIKQYCLENTSDLACRF
jgi:peptidoglycan hydrolase-like protein with peptidoglycan-binding domain